MTPRTESSQIARDRRIGQRLVFFGGARILREAEQAPTNRERLTRWRVAYSRTRAQIRAQGVVA